MDFRAAPSVIGKASMMGLLMVVVAMWVFGAIAGMNEDLLAASARGDLPEVKRLLAKGADVNAMDKDGETALIEASREGHQEVVQALLAKGAKVSLKPEHREHFNEIAWATIVGGILYSLYCLWMQQLTKN